MATRLMMIIPTLVQGGAEKQMSLLATGLKRDEFDVSVCVLTRTGPWEDYLKQHGIPVTVIGKRMKWDPIALGRLTLHLRREKPDLIHTWLFAANCYGRVAARWAGIKAVVAGERCVDLWKNEGHFWIDRKLAQHTSALVTNSSAVVDFYAEHGLDRSKFRVIPNGIPFPDPEPQPTVQSRRQEAKKHWARQLGFPDDRKIVLSLARLWPQKRLKDLIWAMDLASCSRDDLQLIIAGEGPESTRLHEFVQETATVPNIHFVGHQSNPESLLRAADCLVVASEYEGQSNSLMEAMWHRIPVIVSDIPGNRDLILGSEQGYLFRTGDRSELAKAIIHLFGDTAVAQQKSEAAYRHLERNFQWDQMVERYADLYRELTQ